MAEKNSKESSVTIEPDWRAYLDRFHAELPGITERVLSRCRDDRGRDPYEWAYESLPDAGRVLDLACGSAPLFPDLAGRWTGLDRSRAELELAAAGGARPVVVADATAAPLRPATFDSILCAMGLMIVQPLELVLVESAWLLRPTARLVALLPATRPLSTRDRLRYLRLLVALKKARLAYPNDRELADAPGALGRAGFRVVDDRAERFELELASGEAAEQFVRSLYLPDARPEHVRSAIAVARRWAGTRLGIPLRRVVAERT